MSSSATASIRVDSSGRVRRPVSASRPAFARRRRSWAANAASFSEGVASDESGTGAAGGGDGSGTSTRGAGGGDGGGTEQQLVRGVDVTAGSSLLRRAFWAAAASRFSWRRRRRAAGVTAEKSFAFAPPMCARTARDARRTGGVDCFNGVICSTFTRFSFASRNSR